MRLSRRDLWQIAVAALIGLGIAWMLRQNAPIGRDIGSSPIIGQITRGKTAPIEGPADADLILIAFTDYQCGACRIAHPAMKAAAARDRRVRIIYKDWPIFGPRSEAAARLALAAARQGVYPRLHDRLMTETRPLDAPVILSNIAATGGDPQAALAALETHGEAIDAALADTARQAYALGLRGTPSYLIGPILVTGALDEEGFRKAFAQARTAGRP